MSRITITRTDEPWPAAAALDGVRSFLFGAINGFTHDDRKGWGKFWKKVANMEPGEIAEVDMVFPRSSPYHRRHMKIEQAVFDAQERFGNFERFRDWLKIGAGWVEWAPGAKGGVVPLPLSVSYAAADQAEFERYHRQVIEFLRSGHAAKRLWPHLADPDAMMNAVLEGFQE